MAFGVNCARSVIDRDFLVVEFGLSSCGIRVCFLFSLELERSIGNNHVFFGAVGAMVMRRAPVVRRIPLFRVKRSAVKIVFKNEIPTAKICGRSGNSKCCKRSDAPETSPEQAKILFHIQIHSSPTTSAKNSPHQKQKMPQVL